MILQHAENDTIWDEKKTYFIKSIWNLYDINLFTPEQNGHHFTDDSSKYISIKEKSVFWFKFHWSLFLRVPLANIGPDDGMVPKTTDKPLSEPMLTQFTDIDGIVQDWSIPVANALGVLQHDDVIKWRHFPRYWPSVWGFHRSPVNSLHKGQWRGALMFSLICA